MADCNVSKNELSEAFMKNFNIKRESLKDSIDKLLPDHGVNLEEKLSELSAEIQKMSKSLHDAIMFLPSYSVKIRQNEIRDLERMLKEKEDMLVPKKKFGFKSKLTPVIIADKPTDSSTELQKTKEIVVDNSSTKDNNFFTIENLRHQAVNYGEDVLNGNDVMIKDSEDSVIVLVGGPSTLRLANLRRCKLLCGPVRTSIFIDKVYDSILYLCCQQLRTHSSERLDIYLRVASRAIIEDCTKIRFGPYTWVHEKAEELHSKAEIDSKLERYDAVDDFNWLSASQSPNWGIIPETDWKSLDENK